MHKFERFIVYPLLIVALFHSMSGKQINTTAQKVGDIVAESITIVNDEGIKMIELGTNEKEVRLPKDKGEKNNLEFGEIKTYDERGEIFTALSAIQTRYVEVEDLAGSFKTYNNEDEATVIGRGIKTYNTSTLYDTGENPTVKIGEGHISLYNDEGDSQISLRRKRNGGGILNIYNKHNEKVISLEQTVPDEEGQSGEHGLITIYDKSGEDFRSYTHSFVENSFLISENSPKEIVETFYEGFAKKNINKVIETTNIKLGNLEKVIIRADIMEKASSEDEIYSVKNLEINQVEGSSVPKFKVKYSLSLNKEEGKKTYKMEDILMLKNIETIWQINKIKGDINKLITDNF